MLRPGGYTTFLGHSWVRSADAREGYAAGTWEQRSRGRRFLIKVTRIVCQESERTTQTRVNTTSNRLSHEDMFQWARLHRIVLHGVVAPYKKEPVQNHHTRPDALESQPFLRKLRPAKTDTFDNGLCIDGHMKPSLFRKIPRLATSCTRILAATCSGRGELVYVREGLLRHARRQTWQ